MADLSPEEYKALMQKREQKAFAILKAQTKNVMQNEMLFKDLLYKLALHTTTSVSNAILIQAQMPTATAVNSIKAWEQRNIEVKKDENGYYPKGIYIFEENGQRIDENTGEVKTKIRVSKGYDASQTTYPDAARKVMNTENPVSVFIGINDAQKARNLALVKSSPIRCVVYGPNKLIDDAENISEETGVRYVEKTKTVIIRSIERQEWFARVAFEIALGLFHKADGSAFNREQRSFEAGIVSYLLSVQSGADTTPFHFDLTNLEILYADNESGFRSMIERSYETAHNLNHRLQETLKKEYGIKEPQTTFGFR